MALSSFGKILTVLDLFSVSRPVINVDIICEELGLSKPTSYRYLKELVSSDILQRISGTSGDYTLGSKIAVLDYISRNTDLLSYGRGCPRPVYVGSSPKVILAHLPKQRLHNYYERFATQLSEVGFAQDLESFMQQMKKIKKQGYYFSQGELDPRVSGLSVPIRFSSKEAPMALTVLASRSRFEFINVSKLIETLKENAAQIEKKFSVISEEGN